MEIILTAADKFYLRNGKKPCCSGCDWWLTDDEGAQLIGECTRSAPVSAKERYSMIEWIKTSSIRGIENDAGHILTRREHSCGDFKDDFDWSNTEARIYEY